MKKYLLSLFAMPLPLFGATVEPGRLTPEQAEHKQVEEKQVQLSADEQRIRQLLKELRKERETYKAAEGENALRIEEIDEKIRQYEELLKNLRAEEKEFIRGVQEQEEPGEELPPTSELIR